MLKVKEKKKKRAHSVATVDNAHLLHVTHRDHGSQLTRCQDTDDIHYSSGNNNSISNYQATSCSNLEETVKKKEKHFPGFSKGKRKVSTTSTSGGGGGPKFTSTGGSGGDYNSPDGFLKSPLKIFSGFMSRRGLSPIPDINCSQTNKSEASPRTAEDNETASSVFGPSPVFIFVNRSSSTGLKSSREFGSTGDLLRGNSDSTRKLSADNPFKKYLRKSLDQVSK